MGFHCLLKQPIQNPGSDRALSVFLNFFDTCEQAIKIFSGMGGEYVNRGVAKKEEVSPNLIDNGVEKISDAAWGLNEVKLIDDDNAGLIGFLDESCNLLVLGGNSIYRIYDQGADICTFDGFLRPHDAKDFDGGVVFSARSHAGGVNQEIGLAVPLVGDIDRIPRRAGSVADDRALILENRIDEG